MHIAYTPLLTTSRENFSLLVCVVGKGNGKLQSVIIRARFTCFYIEPLLLVLVSCHFQYILREKNLVLIG